MRRASLWMEHPCRLPLLMEAPGGRWQDQKFLLSSRTGSDLIPYPGKYARLAIQPERFARQGGVRPKGIKSAIAEEFPAFQRSFRITRLPARRSTLDLDWI